MVLSLEDWGPITAQQIVVQQESKHVSVILKSLRNGINFVRFFFFERTNLILSCYI